MTIEWTGNWQTIRWACPDGMQTDSYPRRLNLHPLFHVRRFAADVERRDTGADMLGGSGQSATPVGASPNGARIGGSCFNARDCTRAAVGAGPTAANDLSGNNFRLSSRHWGKPDGGES